MKHVFSFAALLILGCSSGDPSTPIPAEAGDVAGSGGSAGAGGGAGAAGRGGATGGGAGAPADAGPDRQSPPDAGPDTAEASLSDRQGGDATEGGSDVLAPDVVDAAADARVEAGIDGAVDAAADVRGDTAADAGVAPVCPVPSNANCQSAIETDGMIRATFPQPCSPEGQAKCGGVYYGPPNNLTMTYPILCRSGIWRFGGSWSGSQWVPSHSCSNGCAASQICDP